MASNTSSRVIMPRSPCAASAACTNIDGVPVDASVAAILRAMCPLLPTPLTTTRPLQASNRSTALGKRRVDAIGQRRDCLRFDLQYLAGECECTGSRNEAGRVTESECSEPAIIHRNFPLARLLLSARPRARFGDL